MDLMGISEQSAVSIDEIWNSFTAQLRRFIASRVHTEADVDDILQEVFIKIHRGIDKLEDPSKLHAWIFQITRNAIADHYRKTEHYVEASDELPEVLAEETASEEVAAEGS